MQSAFMSFRKLTVLALMAGAAALGPADRAFPAAAQDAGFGGGGSSSQRAEITLVWRDAIVHAGEDAALGVIFDMAPGWHVQAGAELNHPDATYATNIRIEVPEGWSADPPRWPEPETFTVGEGEFALSIAGYAGRMLAMVPVRVPADAAPGEYTMTARVEYQACDDQTCEMPQEVSATTTLTVAASDAAEAGGNADEATEALFAAFPGEPSPGPPAETNPPIREAGDSAASEEAASEAAGPRFFGVTLPRLDGFLGILLLALLSAVGGFILNLTPCVLPVIPIKIMTMMQHADKPGKNLVLGIWMAAGVISFWVGIGLPVAVFRSVADPSQLFGIWWVTLGIGVLIALMGVGIMGLFTFQLPKAVYAVNPKADSAHGSFLFGVMTAVLGLPCFGFVAGALLAGSATLPAGTIMLIFASLGVGMAAPYFVLAAKPALIERIPRTGPASELVKQVMGLLLLAAAAYFIGSGLIGLVLDRPYLARQLHWWAVAVFASMAALWMVLRTFQITRRPSPRLAFLLMGIVLAGATIVMAANSTAKARDNWNRLAASRSAGGPDFVPGAWNEYTPAAVEAARAAGYVVVLDFTAEWCINCKFLKATVLNRDPVQRELHREDVVSFTVDLTPLSAPGWDLLRDLGRTGIPLLVIYAPGSDSPWQSNAYTPQQVLSALEEARAEELARR